METSTKDIYQAAGVDFSNLADWQPIKKTQKAYDQFTVDQLRLLARYRSTNGIDVVCKKIGKNLYFHIPGFSVWISKQ